MSTLRIGHGNGHNHVSLVHHVRASDADSYGCNEAQMLLPELRNIPNRRVTVAGPGTLEDRNRAQATSIVTKSHLENLGQLAILVSERDTADLRVAPDRFLVGAFFAHPVATEAGARGIAHFELHAHAAVKDRNPDIKRVREYRRGLAATRKAVKLSRSMGLLPVVTGDLQLAEDEPWGGPVADLAIPCKLKTRNRRIDWIMVDQRLSFATNLEVTDLYDHPAFVANLKAAR